MADLYATSDYREYLREVFEERKAANGLYSYRLWARQLGIDPSQLFRILSKDLQLPIRHVDAVIKNLKLRKAEAEAFRILVELGRARTEKERKALVERLLAGRDVRKNTLSREQYLFFQEWYHTTVRCLVGAGDGREEWGKLAQKVIPPLQESQVRTSIQLQESLGLLRREKGRVVLGDAHLSTDEKEVHRAIRAYQAEMLHRGAEALERFSKDDRDFSTLTFAVDHECAQDISEILREARRQIQKRIEESGDPDRVMHLSLNLFPTAYVGDSSPWTEGNK